MWCFVLLSSKLYVLCCLLAEYDLLYIRKVCPFIIFLLAIVLSVLLQYSDSDYPFGIFKLLLQISKG